MPNPVQLKIIEELNIVKNFDVDFEIRRRIDFLKNYLVKSGMKSYILGISGGVDSTTAGRLAQLAVTELKNEGYCCNFIAVRLPYGRQKDSSDANDAIHYFIKPNHKIDVNIKDSTDNICSGVRNSFIKFYEEEKLDFVKGNIKARQRMIVQYTVAGLEEGLVIGTDHGAEAVMGFFTKYGDGAADILPLSGLNKRMVRAIAEKLGAPIKLVNKIPTADLEDDRPGLPDEVAHGVTYDQIDDFLEGKDIDINAHSKIVAAYNKTKHKRALPVTI